MGNKKNFFNVFYRVSLCLVLVMTMGFTNIHNVNAVEVATETINVSNGETIEKDVAIDIFKKLETKNVVLKVDGKAKIIIPQDYAKKNTLTITGTKSGDTLTLDGSVQSICSLGLSDASLEISNIRLEMTHPIRSLGKVSIYGTTTLVNTKSLSVLNMIGESAELNVSTPKPANEITINSKVAPIMATTGAKVNINGGDKYFEQGFVFPKVNINYIATETNKFPITGDGNFSIGSGVKITDGSTENILKNTTPQEAFEFASKNVKEGAFLWNTNISGERTNLYEIGDEDSAKALSSVAEVKANHFIGPAKEVIPSAIEYSKVQGKEINAELLKDSTVPNTFNVIEGGNLTLKPNDKSLTSTDTTTDGGAAFFLHGGTLSVKGNGKIKGTRTGINSDINYPSSVLNIVSGKSVTYDNEQGLVIEGGSYHPLHLNAGSLKVISGEFKGPKGVLINRNVKLDISGGNFNTDIKDIVADGYTTRKDNDNEFIVVKEDSTDLPETSSSKDWWNPNGTIETNPLYVYNRGLSTKTNENPKTWEINGGKSAAGVGNILAKTIDTNVGLTYKYEFDFTNRVGVSRDENTFETYVYPGSVNGNITQEILNKSTKIGEYYGNNNSWTHVKGEFTAKSSDTTFFFKSKKSSGLGGVIKYNTLSINRNTYNPNIVDNNNNAIKNGDFETTSDWIDLNTNLSAEIHTAGTYTNAPKSKGNVLEVNGDHQVNVNAVGQSFNTLKAGKFKVSFDFLKRVHSQGDLINNFEVYVVDKSKVTTVEDLSKFTPNAYLLGNASNWQTSSFYCDVPEGQTNTLIVFKAMTKSGSGIIIDNVQVDDLSWTPELEGVTDTTLVVKEVKGATSYQLLDENKIAISGRLPQSSNKFTGLEAGKKYTVAVVKDNETKYVEGVTTKRVGSLASETTAIKVLAVGVHGIVFENVKGQEYSYDGGKTWFSSDDEKTFVYDSLDMVTNYTILTRVSETFDKMYGEVVSVSPTTLNIVSPEINSRSEKNVIINTLDNQEYSIDNGVTWKSSTTGTINFDNLKEGTSYTIMTRVKENTYFDASETKEISLKTKIIVKGVVTGEDLPATVTIVDPETKKVIGEVITDEKGNWELALDEGEYIIKVEGFKKEESFEGKIVVKAGENNSITSKLEVKKVENNTDVKTSDDSSTIIYLSIMVFVACLGGVVFKKSRKDKNLSN